MFSMVGVGGHNWVVATSAVHFHVARKCLVSSLAASEPLSVNGMNNCHHMISFFPGFSHEPPTTWLFPTWDRAVDRCYFEDLKSHHVLHVQIICSHPLIHEE